MRTGDGLASLANWFSFTWRPLGREDEWVDELLVALATDLRTQASQIIMSPLPDEDGSATRLEHSFRKGGWIVFREHCDENHILPVEGRSFAEYWSYRPGKMRTTFKRKAKKVDVEIFTRFEEAAWSAYRSIYAESWKPEEERADLLEDFARAEGAAGRIRLGIARADGVPVAAQFWTVEGDTAYIHKLAHIKAAKPLSAGTTLSAALFEHVIDTDKVDLVDFGTGSDAYKRDWMERNRPRYRLTCLDWRQPKAWFPLAKALARRLARGRAPG
ncbi:GNAT family N-acetyltransferase [Erythrobacter mangrovi]|uniref:GNAT family N-acetyltransferase n=1 Tax=Erythrobacter mangrovi TaxID=2739433 RepID=UPI001F1CAD25|nr:GNAT family N-acetyltransferase [Erythrobacter mangrovi]